MIDCNFVLIYRFRRIWISVTLQFNFGLVPMHCLIRKTVDAECNKNSKALDNNQVHGNLERRGETEKANSF